MKTGILLSAAAAFIILTNHLDVAALAANATTDPTQATGGRVQYNILRAVVKIVSSIHPGKASIGTGFLASREVAGATGLERRIYLVTNKHVLSDWDRSDGTITKYSQTINVYFYRTSDSTAASLKPVSIQIADASGKAIAAKLALHPDPAIDVAVVQLTEELAPANKIDLMSFDKSFFLSFSDCVNFAGVGDQVFALGYPQGVTSLTNNLPIAKAGYVASVPGQEFKIDVPTINRAGNTAIAKVEGKYLLVDGLIVPGNSGGPVVIPAETKVRIDPQTKAFQHTTKPIENLVAGIVSGALGGSGLTLVISSDYILELINSLP